MNFKKATNRLLAGQTLQDLADQIGVSVQAVRQARTDEASLAFRIPPNGWEEAVIQLAKTRIKQLERLITDLSQAKRAP